MEQAGNMQVRTSTQQMYQATQSNRKGLGIVQRLKVPFQCGCGRRFWIFTLQLLPMKHAGTQTYPTVCKKKKTTFAGVLLFDVVFKGGKGGDMVQFRRRYKKACAGSIRVHSMGKQSK